MLGSMLEMLLNLGPSAAAEREAHRNSSYAPAQLAGSCIYPAGDQLFAEQSHTLQGLMDAGACAAANF